MARTGRPQRPHQPSWGGDPIIGLYHCPDGRWRINATGEKFTEKDEARAIRRFYELTRRPKALLPVVTAATKDLAEVAQVAAAAAREGRQQIRIHIPRDHTKPTTVSRMVNENEVWDYVKQMLNDQPGYVAEMLGIPERNLRKLPIEQPGLTLQKIIDTYQTQSPASEKAKKEALAPLRRLMDKAGAAILDDLTTEHLLAFRHEIENDAKLTSAGTRKGYYGRIKSIIAFGMKAGLDAEQIRAALDRAKVLWTADPLPPVQPRPIGREDFHKLLASGNGTWRAWLLVGLNLCLHMEEVCGLKWDDFNLDAGTYAAIRGKTRRQRIPRAATLWPETVTALKAIERRGPFVFTSTHGTRYNRNTRVNDFKDLRTKAGLPDEVTFDTIRDGAYTAACHGTTDERQARVLAGHKAAGLQDNYVLRNPAVTRPACEAVYKVYGPFPA